MEVITFNVGVKQIHLINQVLRPEVNREPKPVVIFIQEASDRSLFSEENAENYQTFTYKAIN